AIAVSENLNAMLALGTEHQRESGILFIKIEGFEKLAERHGAEGRETLLRKFASVVIRAVREADLVCRYDEDTLAVLFPSIEEGYGPTLADAVRKSVLSHQFRLSESGPSVIVNAHYGYSDCLPHENEDLVLNRAGNALAKSESKGCNQMHIHNGESLLHLASRH
ncbi:MAG: GGDEF domain-containing protein, partial [Planctomycetaceae bacterium]|nr:GGDEF domain-containing protein [Planctomycetaceae bacterium]